MRSDAARHWIPTSRPQETRGSAKTVVQVAALQLSPVLDSREGTVDKVCRQILALGRERVQFASWPTASRSTRRCIPLRDRL
jgi:hypothetical protein